MLAVLSRFTWGRCSAGPSVAKAMAAARLQANNRRMIVIAGASTVFMGRIPPRTRTATPVLNFPSERFPYAIRA